MGSDEEEDSHTKESSDQSSWGTWDDLLLASAVKRHGFLAWDSVSLELQSRTSLPLHLTTPDNCRLRYLHLKRRFSHHPSPDASAAASASDKAVHIPWLEELRNLRVAELQQEVQRYDVSILSLQSKVKKLEEEREDSLREKHQKPDLVEDSRGDGSVKDKRESSAAERLATKSAAGEDSDRENRSVNESNSTGVKSERDKTGDEVEEGGGRQREGENEPVRAGTGSGKTDRASEGTKPEGVDSYNGSSEPNRERRGEEGEEGEGEEEEEEEERERPESVAQSKENSSDVQSSASLTQKKKNKNKKSKRKRKGRRLVEISGGEEQQGTEDASPAVDLGGKKESQPLVDVLKMIRAHKHAFVFERRLPLQESEKYKGMVRQHVDLEWIESRVERGFYSSSSLPFYRDLLLLFNNALVFHPKSSVESLAALDLLRLVSSHFRKTPSPASHSLSHSQISSSTPDAPERSSDPLLPKHKSSSSAAAAAPIIVCRRSAQQPINSDKKPALDSKPAHEQGLIKMNAAAAAAKERSVVTTGTRSLRRSSNKIIKNTSPAPNPTKKQTPTSTSVEKAENSNSKAEGMVAASTKKRSAADFLKRIKRNSPAGGKSKNSGSESSNNNNNNASNNKKANSKNNKNKKSEKGGEERKEEGSPSKPRTVGRPPKKGGTPEYSNVKRGREVGGAKESVSASTLKRPRKRARR